MPRQTRRPGRDPRGKRWFPAQEVPFDAAPLRAGGILVGPVTIIAAAAAASMLIVVPAAPVAQAKPLAPVVQEIDEPKPSRLLRITPADLPPPALDRPLYGRIQPIDDPPPSHFAAAGSLVEQGLANLLYQRALAGVVQPVAVVQPSDIVRIPFAERTPSVARPLAGVVQDVVGIDPSKIIRVPFAELTPSTQHPLAGVLQDVAVVGPSTLIRVPVADVIIPVDVLFQRSLQGREQGDELRYSLLVGGRLPITRVPLRPATGVVQDIVDGERASRILRVPIADVTAPALNVLFQRPRGVGQDVIADVTPRIIPVPVADVPPTPLSLFLQPLAGREPFDQPRIGVSLLLGSRLSPTVPPELFQRPLAGIARPSFDDSQLEDISVILFGLEPERDVLFLRPLAGRLQPPTVVGQPQIITVTAPTPHLDPMFQRPLGVAQELPVFGPSQIIRVIPPTPHLDPLFQRPLVGAIQEIPEVGLPRFVLVPVPDVVVPVVSVDVPAGPIGAYVVRVQVAAAVVAVVAIPAGLRTDATPYNEDEEFLLGL